ncbi:hypothetical protein GIB67_005011 [Kingdonia uniflora]|uniref:Aminotransferase-like plant mobile domain-containing protein n=1 Tax=Kingdonia uniflora TaxID=39325 RepID=A0A7J7NMP2_9MAGN|nr:hypothetical protein GIB67_005011 [Kingdonia uniflora]
MAALYRGLDEVSVLKPGKVKKSITEFYAVLEYWFFEYYRVRMYLVKNCDKMQCRGSLEKVLKWYQWIAKYATLKRLADDMGFEEFLSIKAVNSDSRLIHTLVESWLPSTHTFYFPCGDLGFTPLDFIIRTGLFFGMGFKLLYDDKYIIGTSKFDWGTPIMAA